MRARDGGACEATTDKRADRDARRRIEQNQQEETTRRGHGHPCLMRPPSARSHHARGTRRAASIRSGRTCGRGGRLRTRPIPMRVDASTAMDETETTRRRCCMHHCRMRALSARSRRAYTAATRTVRAELRTYDVDAHAVTTDGHAIDRDRRTSTHRQCRVRRDEETLMRHASLFDAVIECAQLPSARYAL